MRLKTQELAFATARQLAKQKRITDWLGENTSWENPFSDERSRYPYPMFEREREHGAFYWNKIYRNWVALGYSECQEVLASPDFSGGSSMRDLLLMQPYRSLTPTSIDFIGKLLLFLDGDVHARIRRLVSRAFTPRQVVALEPRMTEIADELLSHISPTGTTDIFATFTSTFPVQIMGELLGVPQSRWSWLHQVSGVLTQTLDPLRGFDPAEVDTAILELRGYIMGLADTRREAPADDLITALVQVEDAGERLTLNELVGLVGTLIVAGSETTTGLMGNALVNLVRYPEQRKFLASNPEVWPNAVEEMLRYDPPATFAPRTALRTTTIAGTTIEEGQLVAIMIGAANRDPLRYDDPHILKLDRPNPTPLSFGHGVHYCVGAALARTSTRIGLKAFLDRFGDYTIDLDEVVWRTSSAMRGPTSIPITLP